MINTILASKGTMGAAFVKGRRFPVTKVLAGPCVVTQVKKMDKDGYWAVQLGFGERRIKNITKAMQGHLRKTQNSKLKNQSLTDTTITSTGKQNSKLKTPSGPDLRVIEPIGSVKAPEGRRQKLKTPSQDLLEKSG